MASEQLQQTETHKPSTEVFWQTPKHNLISGHIKDQFRCDTKKYSVQQSQYILIRLFKKYLNNLSFLNISSSFYFEISLR